LLATKRPSGETTSFSERTNTQAASGFRRNITLDPAKRYAAAYGISARWILMGP
jgi:hypothetical protein